MSIYREEAIDALIEAVRRKDFSNSQMVALDALLSLSGRLNSSGEPYTEAWLLKIAGFDQPYNTLMKAEELRKHDNDLMETMVCLHLSGFWLIIELVAYCVQTCILNLFYLCNRERKRKLQALGREG